MNSNNKPERPVQSFKVGAVRAAVWRRSFRRRDGASGVMAKVALDRSYKDGNDEWQSTHSLDLNDLPKAILALQRTYAYLMDKPLQDEDDGGDGPPEEVVE